MKKAREFWIDDHWIAHRMDGVDREGYDPEDHLLVREVLEPAPGDEVKHLHNVVEVSQLAEKDAEIARLKDEVERFRKTADLLSNCMINLSLYFLHKDHKGQEIIRHFAQKSLENGCDIWDHSWRKPESTEAIVSIPVTTRLPDSAAERLRGILSGEITDSEICRVCGYLFSERKHYDCGLSRGSRD